MINNTERKIILAMSKNGFKYKYEGDKNMKLFTMKEDVLTDRVNELSSQISFLQTHNRLLEEELNYYKYMSENKFEFEQYRVFKEKVTDLLDSNYKDTEDIKFEYNLAVKEGDMDKIKELFEELLKYQSPKLLSIIEEQQYEIQCLRDEIIDLENKEEY